MKSAFLFIAICFVSTLASGQEWMNWVTSDMTFTEIRRTADSYFATVGTGKGTGYKQYMRWQEQAALHLNSAGELTNYSALNMKAYDSARRNRSLSRDANHGTWENLGPFDYYTSDSYSGGGVGRVNCTAFHPTDADIFWVGTPIGGMWKTTNGGADWTPMTDVFASIGISSIAVNPTNPDIIYVLTGDGEALHSPSIGVMKTTDGGSTWSQTGLQFALAQRRFGCKLLIHPMNPNIVFAVYRGGGIYRTDDGGDNWTIVYSGDTVWDIEFKPDDPDIVYATTRTGVTGNFLRSTDTGLSWVIEDDADFPDTAGRVAVAVCPAKPQVVYLLFGGNNADSGTFRGLFKSTNGGIDFELQSNSPNILSSTMSGDAIDDQAGYDLCLAVAPDNDDKVFVAGINMWKSINGGLTWQRETWWLRNDPLNPYVHADWHNLYYEGNKLFANVDGGIYSSEDEGNSWTELSSGLAIMQFYEIDILNDEYMGGTQDNGTNATNVTNPQVHNIWGGDGFGCTWHTGDNSIQYVSSQNAVYRRQFGSAIPISPIEMGDNDFWYTNIEMHTTDPDYVFVSTFNEIYRGNGDAFSFSWDSLHLSDIYTPGGAIVRNFVQGTNDPDKMYACIDSALLRCDDISVAVPVWTSLTPPFFNIENPTDVEVDPDDANRLWVCVSGYTAGMKVYFSPDAGVTWINISGSLPNVPTLSLAYEPGSDDGIYVGTDIGVYYINSHLSDWIYFSDFLPNTQIRDIEISGGYVYAGTFGRGIWRSPVHTPCPYSLVLTPANDPSNPLSTGIQHYHAENSIESTRVIQGNFGDILYGAGHHVDLKNGFWLKSGNLLLVKIEGCPD